MLKRFTTTANDITAQNVNQALAGIKRVRNGAKLYSICIVPMAGADTTLIYDVVTAFLGEPDKGMKYKKDGYGNILLYFGGLPADKKQRNSYKDELEKMIADGNIIKVDSADARICYTRSGEKYVFAEAQSLGSNYGDTIKNLLGGDSDNTMIYVIAAVVILLIVLLIKKKKSK